MIGKVLRIYLRTRSCKLTPTILLLRNCVTSRNKSKMPKLHRLLKPDPSVRGITELDKSKFEKNVTLPCINIAESKLSDVLPHLKKYMLKLPQLKPVQNLDNETLVFLNPEVISKWTDIEVDDRKALCNLFIKEDNFILRDYKLTYENFTADDIFKVVLPPDQEGMSSFTKVGHIVHVNLREHLLPYKNVIGQVLFDKIKSCETVVNKINIIDNTYRNFQMEVLCGKDNLQTKVKQNGCQFEFDFGTVYWNSRLSTEHERISNFINKGDILFDVFAGVGPFSIPAAKRKCFVYANDLNPESYHWLKHNAKLNKVDKKYLNIFNKDGKDFILEDIKANLPKYINTNNIHIVMNLPALAVEFLKYFIGLYKENEIEKIQNPPTIYVYCFAKGEDYTKITKDLISQSLDCDMSNKIDMYRIVMGKKKHQKLKNKVKVAGAKSLKRKVKAKVVKGQLKQISVKNKAKVSEVDRQLKDIQGEVRQSVKKPETTANSENKTTVIKPNNEEDYKKMQAKSDETLKNLNDIQL